jgi:hypothetical protein
LIADGKDKPRFQSRSVPRHSLVCQMREILKVAHHQSNVGLLNGELLVPNSPGRLRDYLPFVSV